MTESLQRGRPAGLGADAGQAALEYALLLILLYLLFITIDLWARDVVPGWYQNITRWIASPAI